MGKERGVPKFSLVDSNETALSIHRVPALLQVFVCLPLFSTAKCVFFSRITLFLVSPLLTHGMMGGGVVGVGFSFFSFSLANSD